MLVINGFYCTCHFMSSDARVDGLPWVNCGSVQLPRHKNQKTRFRRTTYRARGGSVASRRKCGRSCSLQVWKLLLFFMTAWTPTTNMSHMAIVINQLGRSPVIYPVTYKKWRQNRERRKTFTFVAAWKVRRCHLWVFIK